MSIVGYDCVLYYNNGTEESPAWLPINTVKDVTLNLERNEIDDTSREAEGWRSRKAGLAQWGADFDMIYKTSVVAWEKVRQSFFRNESVEILALDGDLDIDGSEGLRGVAFVTNFERNEPLEEAVTSATTFVGNGTAAWGTTEGGVFIPADDS